MASLRVALFLAGRALWRGSRGVLVMTIVLMGLIYAQLLFVPALIAGPPTRSRRRCATTSPEASRSARPRVRS